MRNSSGTGDDDAAATLPLSPTMLKITSSYSVSAPPGKGPKHKTFFDDDSNRSPQKQRERWEKKKEENRRSTGKGRSPISMPDVAVSPSVLKMIPPSNKALSALKERRGSIEKIEVSFVSLQHKKNLSGALQDHVESEMSERTRMESDESFADVSAPREKVLSMSSEAIRSYRPTSLDLFKKLGQDRQVMMNLSSFIGESVKPITYYREVEGASEAFRISLRCVLNPVWGVVKGLSETELATHMVKQVELLAAAFSVPEKDLEKISKAMIPPDKIDDLLLNGSVIIDGDYYDALISNAQLLVKEQLEATEALRRGIDGDKGAKGKEPATSTASTGGLFVYDPAAASKSLYGSQSFDDIYDGIAFTKMRKSSLVEVGKKLDDIRGVRDAVKAEAEAARKKREENLVKQAASAAASVVVGGANLVGGAVAVGANAVGAGVAAVGGAITGHGRNPSGAHIPVATAPSVPSIKEEIPDMKAKPKKKKRGGFFACFGCVSDDMILDKAPPDDEDLSSVPSVAVVVVKPSAEVAKEEAYPLKPRTPAGGTGQYTRSPSNGTSGGNGNVELVKFGSTRKDSKQGSKTVVEAPKLKPVVIRDHYDFPGKNGFNKDGVHRSFILLFKVLLQQRNPSMETPESLQSGRTLAERDYSCCFPAHEKEYRTTDSTYGLQGLNSTAIEILEEVQFQYGLDNLFSHIMPLASLNQNLYGAINNNTVTSKNSDVLGKHLNIIHKRLVLLESFLQAKEVPNAVCRDVGMNVLSQIYQSCCTILKGYRHFLPEGKPQGAFPLVPALLEKVINLQPLLAGSRKIERFPPFKKTMVKLLSYNVAKGYYLNRILCSNNHADADEGEGNEEEVAFNEVTYEYVFSYGFVGMKLGKVAGDKYATILGFEKDVKKEGAGTIRIGLAEGAKVIQVGDKVIAVGTNKTFSDESTANWELSRYESLLKEESRPLTIRFLTKMEDVTIKPEDEEMPERKRILPLDAAQMCLLVKSSTADYKGTLQYFSRDAFSLCSEVDILGQLGDGPMSLASFEAFEIYNNFILDLLPFMNDYPLSTQSFDSSLFSLYHSLTEFMKEIENAGLIGTFIRPVKFGYFFGRHVNSWIEVTHKKVVNDLIPNVIKAEKWAPISEDVRHSQSCIDLEWIVNQNAQFYEALPFYENENTGIARFARRLLCGPLDRYTDLIGKSIDQLIVDHTTAAPAPSSTSTSPDGKQGDRKGSVNPPAGGRVSNPPLPLVTAEPNRLEITTDICIQLNNLHHMKGLLRSTLILLKDIKLKQNASSRHISEGGEYDDNEDDTLDNQFIRTADFDHKASLDEEEEDILDDLLIYNLLVQVHKGAGLPKMDVIGTCDPYLKLRCANTRQDLQEGIFDEYITPIIYNTLDPVWEISTPLDFGDMVEKDSLLVVEAWDNDKISDDDYIGTFEIDLGTMVNADEVQDWYPINLSSTVTTATSGGKILMSVKYTEEQVGFVTESHINRTMNDSMDKLVANVMGTISNLLSEMVFSNPVTEFPHGESLNDDVCESRGARIFELFGKQLKTLNQNCYVAVFEKILLKALKAIVTELCNILILNSFLNPHARGKEQDTKESTWVPARLTLVEDAKLNEKGGGSFGDWFGKKKKPKNLILCKAQLSLVYYFVENLKAFLHSGGDGMREAVINRECRQLDNLLLLLFGDEDELNDLLTIPLSKETPGTPVYGLSDINEMTSIVERLKRGAYEVTSQQVKLALLFRGDF